MTDRTNKACSRGSNDFVVEFIVEASLVIHTVISFLQTYSLI